MMFYYYNVVALSIIGRKKTIYDINGTFSIWRNIYAIQDLQLVKRVINRMTLCFDIWDREYEDAGVLQ